MMLALLLAALPVIFWDQGPETAVALKQNGIEQVLVPAERLQAWKATDSLFAGSRLPSGVPWRKRWRPVSTGKSRWPRRRVVLTSLPMAGALSETAQANIATPCLQAKRARRCRSRCLWADATLQLETADLESAGKMLAFLRGLPATDLPGLADIAVVDDRHPLVGEVMNLLARRNLLFTAVTAPDPRYAINIRIGSKEYSEEEAANPSEFALKIRRQLTDERRSVRIYGSETVLCRLTGDGTRIRLHLLNYRGGKVDGLRIRLRGAFRKGQARSDQIGEIPLENFGVLNGVTEFSIPVMNLYAVIDLERAK